jgi:hypothetical protein
MHVSMAWTNLGRKSLAVIASEAKQSRLRPRILDCFVGCAFSQRRVKD